MTAKELLTILEEIEKAGKDVYAKGCYGQTLTKTLLQSKRNQSPSMKAWYDAQSVQDKSKTNYEYLMTKLGYQGFDCVCLIKGILWGSRPGRCGTYKSNSVPDVTANGLFERCTDVTADLNEMEEGMCIWMSGHVGIVAGKDVVYETSPKTGRVVKRAVSKQPWKKVGYLPWITYKGATADTSSRAKLLKVVRCYALNVRSGPGMQYPVVRVLHAGDSVQGFEKSQNGWWRIGENRWASGSYLA